MDISQAREFAIGAATHLQNGLDVMKLRWQPDFDPMAVAGYELKWAASDLRRTSDYFRSTDHWDRDLVQRLDEGARVAMGAVTNLMHHSEHIYPEQLGRAVADAKLAVQHLNG